MQACFAAASEVCLDPLCVPQIQASGIPNIFWKRNRQGMDKPTCSFTRCPKLKVVVEGLAVLFPLAPSRFHHLLSATSPGTFTCRTSDQSSLD